MDFNHAQRLLEALQAQCPNTETRDVDVWVSAITRAREALLELQINEDKAAQASAHFDGITDQPHYAGMIAVTVSVRH